MEPETRIQKYRNILSTRPGRIITSIATGIYALVSTSCSEPDGDQKPVKAKSTLTIKGEFDEDVELHGVPRNIREIDMSGVDDGENLKVYFSPEKEGEKAKGPRHTKSKKEKRQKRKAERAARKAGKNKKNKLVDNSTNTASSEVTQTVNVNIFVFNDNSDNSTNTFDSNNTSNTAVLQLQDIDLKLPVQQVPEKEKEPEKTGQPSNVVKLGGDVELDDSPCAGAASKGLNAGGGGFALSASNPEITTSKELFALLGDTPHIGFKRAGSDQMALFPLDSEGKLNLADNPAGILEQFYQKDGKGNYKLQAGVNAYAARLDFDEGQKLKEITSFAID